jgi:DNA-binding transcriptional ArsR family regulator
MVGSTVDSSIFGTSECYFRHNLNSSVKQRGSEGGEEGGGVGAVLEPLQVIASPRRLRILELVWDRDLSAGEIAAQFDVSWPAISQHLTVLRTAGFVTERREGTSRIYRADQAALGSLRAVVEEHWRAGLTRLKALAEQAERAQQDKDRR